MAINSPYSIAIAIAKAVYFHGTVKLDWHGLSLLEFHVPFSFTHQVQRIYLDFVIGYLELVLHSYQNFANVIAFLSVPSPFITTASLKIKSIQRMYAIAITVADFSFNSSSGFRSISSTKDSDIIDSN